MPRGQLAAPAGQLRRLARDVFEPRGIHGITLGVLESVRGEVQVTVRPDQLEDIVERVLTAHLGDLVGECADGEGLEYVAHRAQPADPHHGLGLAHLDADVAHVVGHVDRAEPQLERHRRPGRWIEGREYGRVSEAMTPSDQLSIGVEPGAQ